MMRNGLNVAQVSDAGMPAISDPGEDLVKLAIEGNRSLCNPGTCRGILGACSFRT